MRVIPKGTRRNPPRATVSFVVVASVTAACVTVAAAWHGHPAAAVAALLGSALVVSVFVLVRTGLCRASLLIDTILHEELDTEPSASPVADEQAAERYGG